MRTTMGRYVCAPVLAHTHIPRTVIVTPSRLASVCVFIIAGQKIHAVQREVNRLDHANMCHYDEVWM